MGSCTQMTFGHTVAVAADWAIGHPEGAERRPLGEPLQPDRLSMVMRGDDRLGTWELRDGPHPLAQDPDAVGHELITQRRDGGSTFGGVGPRLQPGQVSQAGTCAGGWSAPLDSPRVLAEPQVWYDIWYQ
jgi:hypothetical protein